jgi:hypothetical protein
MRTGVCWDNAVAEAAWSSLKRELVHRYRFRSRAEARRAIFARINLYNTRRRHSSLGNIAPVEWENRYRQTKANPAAQTKCPVDGGNSTESSDACGTTNNIVPLAALNKPLDKGASDRPLPMSLWSHSFDFTAW